MLTDYKRVLCPVQLDQHSLTTLAVGKEIAKKNNGKLFVLHVVSPHTDPTRVGGAAMAGHDEKVSQQELAKIEREHLGDIEHETLMRLGHPAEEIAKAEHEFGIDLVVMATHGRVGLPHELFGSITERVVQQSRCPVLTVRLEG